MSDWREKTLGDVIVLQRGFDLTEKTATPGPHPVISSGGISYSTNIAKVDGPGVVTGRKGVLGKVHYSSRPYWPHDTTLWVKDFKGSDPRFIYYLLQTLPLASLDAGASNPTLNRNHAHLLPVRVPDLVRQRRISSILGAIDDLIGNNCRRIELLEKMAQTIYREWFVHFRYPGRKDAPLVDSVLGSVPQGWVVRNLFDVAEVAFGFSFKSKSFSTSGPFPVVRIRDILAGETSTFSDEAAPARYRVDDGDLLIGMDGDFHMRQWSSGEAWLNQRVARMRPLDGVSARHLMLALEEPIRHWNSAISGTTVAHLGKRHLEQIQVAIPPRSVLKLVGETLDSVSEQERALLKLNRQHVTLRALLLPRLVTGQINVSHLDFDSLVETAAAS